MSVWYSEKDPFAAAWLRELISANIIAPGDVDERDIQDVRPDELLGYSQWHLFAGIGVWPYALRLVGWPDSRSALTVSCPCQPYSAAGKGAGFADERHLWPAAFHIIHALGGRVPVLFGEQVSSAVKHGWWDLVASDLEGIGYTCEAKDFPACSVGAFHKRQRLYFVGHLADPAELRRDERRGTAGAAIQGECSERGGAQQTKGQAGELQGRPEGLRGTGGLAHSQDPDRGRRERGEEAGIGADEQRGRRLAGSGDSSLVADSGLFDSAGRRIARNLGEAPGGTQGEGHQRERLRDSPDHSSPDGGLAHTSRAERGRRPESNLRPGEPLHPANSGTDERLNSGSGAGATDAAIRLDDSAGARHEPAITGTESETRDEARLRGPERGRTAGDLVQPHSPGSQQRQPSAQGMGYRSATDSTGGDDLMGDTPERRLRMSGRAPRESGRSALSGESIELEHPEQQGLERLSGDGAGLVRQELEIPEPHRSTGETGAHDSGNPWSDILWIPCRDGKYRPVQRAIESELIALADGSSSDMGLVRLADYPEGEDEKQGSATYIYAPLIQKGKARVGRLRGYGNAIVARQAEVFIRAYLDTERGR